MEPISQPFDIGRHPIHLGLGATSVPQPEHTGGMEWYMAYGARHGADGKEGRLLSMHTFTSSWDTWEMHPNGSEVVLAVDGTVTFIQEIDGHVHSGDRRRTSPGRAHGGAGDYQCAGRLAYGGDGRRRARDRRLRDRR